jgi:hypothetical protein
MSQLRLGHRRIRQDGDGADPQHAQVGGHHANRVAGTDDHRFTGTDASVGQPGSDA